MSLIDCTLNLAGLLLWLNWVSPGLDTVVRVSSVSLVGTLSRAADTARPRGKFLLCLLLLVGARALLYWYLGPDAGWTAHLQLGVVAVSFRSDYLGRMFLYSALGMSMTLAAFYLWLLFLSTIHPATPDKDPVQKLIRLHLGRLDHLPLFAKLLVPFLITGLAWLLLQPLFAQMGLVPGLKDRNQLLEQAAVVGAGGYLVWKYLVVGVLVLHVLNTYVYLGNHSFWTFINTTARRLLWPLGWLPLRVGKVDFAPLLLIAAIFLVTEFVVPQAFAWLSARLGF